MLGTAFLALMGVGFLAGLADMFNDDEAATEVDETGGDPFDDLPGGETDPDPDPDPDPAVEGADLLYTGEDTLNGTEGNDTLTADNPDHTAAGASLVNLLGGDDVAEVSTALETVVDGGAGDDSLTSTGVGNTLLGGAGNDTLAGINATEMDGGDGDDTLTLDLTADASDTIAVARGGEGTDTISVTATAGLAAFDDGGAVLEGGAGADTFNVTLALDETAPVDGEDPAVVDSGTAMRVSDFDPDEDTLQVTIDRTEGSEDRDLVSSIVTPVTEGDVTYYELVLTFEGTDTASESTSTIRIDSETEVTIEDITVVTNNPVEEAVGEPEPVA